ncbi:MAG: hypothetical protein CL908_21715 [Deltaproteobacteria bacterium]|nr:hypothetical protein [Deltaproteobacteria bacterium]
MADIEMSRAHGLDEREARERIEGLATKVSDRLGGSWSWQGNAAVCEARGARARVAYDEESISIALSLPRMLRPLRGKFEAKIEEYFERYFGVG